VCGLCILAGLVVLVRTDQGRTGQIWAIGLLLLGVVALIAGRVLMALSARRPHRQLN
jgi:hypothetical protein